jgi:ribonuclease-3
LGHFFKDPYLLRQALTHPSAAVEEGRGRLASYERLEFLGDAVVGLNLAALLYERFPQEDEGVLTRMRAYWASQVALAATARELGLESFLRLGAGETRDGGASKDRTLASALEACFGALFLDGGPKAAAKLAKSLWGEPIRRRKLDVLAEDAKTALQERRQAAGSPLPEDLTVPSGEGFSTSVLLDGQVAGRGEGASRKAAEQSAARAALAAALLRLPKDKT